MREWALVRVDIPFTLKAHPTALQDGKFLVEFYTCHPGDKRYNAINQRYWLEYHPVREVAAPYRDKCAHLIRPSLTSAAYAITEGLKPFSQWVWLTNADTYITGPFKICSCKRQKTGDRISRDQWNTLSKFTHLFTNTILDLSLPNYSIHCCQYHKSFTSGSVAAKMDAHLASPSGTYLSTRAIA